MEEKRAHGGNLWRASQRFQLPPDQFLDYSANINPLGPLGGAPVPGRSIKKLDGLLPQPEAED